MGAGGESSTPEPEEPCRRASAASSLAFLSASPPRNCFFRRPNSSYLQVTHLGDLIMHRPCFSHGKYRIRADKSVCQRK